MSTVASLGAANARRMLGARGEPIPAGDAGARAATAFVKLVSGAGGGSAALLRETAALTRLGPPLTPALLGTTQVGGRDALWLEALPGCTLRAFLDGLRTGSTSTESSSRPLALARRMVDAIAAMHALGVVHGDLSARNVMVLDDGTLRLIDFGRATVDGALAPTDAATTPAYSSPELLVGVAPTPASDIYSTGILLFELLTGRPPFAGTTATLRHAHLRRRAPLASLHAPISPTHDALIAACLAKDPAHRPTAAALASAWHAAATDPVAPDATIASTATLATEAAAADRRGRAMAAERAIVGDAPFVGREAELVAAREVLAAARDGRSGWISVIGEAGAGKSRFVAELLAGHGDVYVAAAGAAVGATRPEATQGLAARFAERGGVVIVEDAHRCDPIVLDAAELATLEERGAALVVVAVGRTAMRTQRPALGSRAAVRAELELGPLAATDGRAMAAGMLADRSTIAHAVLDRIVARAGGLPLLIEELTRALCAAGSLQRQADGAVVLDGAEATVAQIDQLVGAELARLPASLRGHAWLHAVLDDAGAGHQAIVDALARGPWGAMVPLDHAAACRSLISTRLLRRDAGVVRFRHEMVREAVARDVPGGLAQAIHAAAYTHLRTLDVPPAVLARHADSAGLHGDAAGHWLAAARLAAARHDYLSAEAATDRTLTAHARTPALTDDDALDARRLRARMRARLGRHVEAGEDFAAVRAQARLRGDAAAEIEALLDEATERDWARDDVRTHALVAEARARIAPSHGAAIAARLAMAEGRSAWRTGDDAAAVRLLEAALDACDPAGESAEDGYETRVAARLMLGFVLAKRGEVERAEAMLAEVRREAHARGDRLHEAAAINNWMAIGLVTGDVERVIEGQREVIAIGRELGRLTVEYRGCLNLALFLAEAGREREAIAVLERGVMLERAVPSMFAVPRATIARARLWARLGDRERARADVEAVGARASCSFDRVILEAARRWCAGDDDGWDDLIEEARADDDRTAMEIVDVRARELRRRGERAEARGLIETALARSPALPGFVIERLRAEVRCGAGVQRPRDRGPGATRGGAARGA